MICRNLKALFLLSLAFFFLFSARLPAEWCYSDEQKAELDNTFEEFETERRAQIRKLEMQAMLYEVAEISITILRKDLKDIKDLSRKAKISWQAERIELIIKSGATGVVIGTLLFMLLDYIKDYISDYLKAQQTTVFN